MLTNMEDRGGPFLKFICIFMSKVSVTKSSVQTTNSVILCGITKTNGMGEGKAP